MKNSVKALGVSGLLVGGLALGSVLSPISLASAQDESPGVEAPADAAGHPGGHGRGGPARFGGEMLDRMVEDGVIDQATADDITVWFEAEKAEHQVEREAKRTEHRETVAGYIGISADDLEAALQDGQSLAEIAEANGKNVDELIDQLTAEAEADLLERAEEHDIPEERVDEMLEQLEDRVEARVNGERPEGRRGPGGHGHRGGFGGAGAPTDGEA